MKAVAVSMIWLVCGVLAAMSIWFDRSAWLLVFCLMGACFGTGVLDGTPVIQVEGETKGKGGSL